MVLLEVQTDYAHNTSRICYSPVMVSILSCPHLPPSVHLFLGVGCQRKPSLLWCHTVCTGEKVWRSATNCSRVYSAKVGAKVACLSVVDEMAELLSPRQLGYGVKGGAEVAAHAARKFLQNLSDGSAMVKLDFRNAFNSIRRDRMLEAVRDLAPTIYQLVHAFCLYSSPSCLVWGEHTIQSAEGVQQSDPLGPPLFCLSIHRHCASLKSSFCVMCLDDVSIGGALENIFHDLNVIKDAQILGLTLNNEKSEIICKDVATRGNILGFLPGAQITPPEKATLLGSPLGDVASIDASLKEKTKALRLMGTRFKHMSAHDSLILLRHSFAIPRLRYLLRTAPCFLSGEQASYDNTLREILGSVTNTLLVNDHQAWASLPVKCGGLGIRRAS